LFAMDEERRLTVERWLIKADHDIKAANASLKLEPPLTDIACFHAQQCAEKSLKAFLAFSDEHIEKTHDLARLLGKCVKRDASFESWKAVLFPLSDYAVTERYPDDWREIPPDEAREAIGKAEKCMAFVKGKILF